MISALLFIFIVKSLFASAKQITRLKGCIPQNRRNLTLGKNNHHFYNTSIINYTIASHKVYDIV